MQKIINSKNYSTVYPKTIERVVEDCVRRFGEKRAEKEAKRILHQTVMLFSMKGKHQKEEMQLTLEKLKENFGEGKELLYDVLLMHDSTRERMAFMEEFYVRIWEITGVPQSIVDWGCGLQPLSRPWMGLPAETRYVGFEIDSQLVHVVNEVTSLENWQTEARLGDVLMDTFEPVDVGFLLKVLPVLEHQKKGASRDVLQKIAARWLVVSFPVSSVSGKEKGMREFYAERYEPIFRELNWVFRKLEFAEELVYVLDVK